MKKFDEELAALRQRLAEMGDLTETMITLATGAILEPQADGLAQLQAHEDRLDQMQVDVDREAIRLLTVYGPVAADLRFILSASRINTALERMGDQALNLCEDLRLMSSRGDASHVPELRKMARLVRSMVHDAIAAFFHRDARKAQATRNEDDMVDAMNDRIIKELLHDEAVRKALSGPGDMAGPLAEILLARSLERIADQATNICEEVVYMVKGADIRHTPEH